MSLFCSGVRATTPSLINRGGDLGELEGFGLEKGLRDGGREDSGRSLRISITSRGSNECNGVEWCNTYRTE